MLKYFLNRLFSFIACGLFLRQISGIQNIPSEKGFILAANHSSYMDIAAMYSSLIVKKSRYIRFIAKKELLQDRIFKLGILLLETRESSVIIIDRKSPEKAFSEALKALDNNEVIGIYPEGGRSRDGKIRKGKTGAVRLALLSGAPIIPVGIQGAYQLMPSGKSLPKIKKAIRLSFGKPMFFAKAKATRKGLESMTEKLMKEIAKLSGQRYNP
ncbi:1-acyl-sn-glycerol-3-phosphate acyltransferase [Candidatus Woesearchaeota archaeon]|nr:1-acyl-sn-glycerol-3-phosphate acyltransferase [Candidatus Woesearchaeota archaeon]